MIGFVNLNRVSSWPLILSVFMVGFEGFPLGFNNINTNIHKYVDFENVSYPCHYKRGNKYVYKWCIDPIESPSYIRQY